ncbi:TonB-dependent siderophore receptor [Pseudomonas aeruginosa]|nr:TonB-dependent siderophore receptor [Pseudomonas aeruginosa]MBG4066344.1 TonB-dependent siderophore receptor [Pseudomonas aeruginosa]MBG5599757.1 TonB-dependent siderophore receptor [Pseudomonas aeruginosa]MBG5754480.1 TonB-dependent siderophore receptor [Pseudomonas aeruginosa]MBH3670970.1 TonB-dependent siderophore receptor [Pseudomonas aeruginosa]
MMLAPPRLSARRLRAGFAPFPGIDPMTHPYRRRPLILPHKPLLHAACLCTLVAHVLVPANAQTRQALPHSDMLEQTTDEEAALALPADTVTGSSEDLSTEGSGSYTAAKSRSGTGLALTPRETPQSLTVITRQRMDDQQLDSLRDVLENTTGVSSTMLDSERVNYFARGFSIDSFMYDGIPTTANAMAPGEGMLDTAFYDRVEVVRGATGLLQGIGEPSASVNLVRKRPLKTFSASANMGLGRWDNQRGTFDLSSPLSTDERVRGRIVGTYLDRDSFQDHYRQKRQAFYGVLDVDLTAGTTLTLGHEYQNNDPKGVTWGGMPLFFSDGTRTDWSRSKNPAARWNRWESRLNTTFARVEQSFDNGWTLRVNADHKESDVNSDLLSMNGYPDRATGLGWMPAALNGGVETRQDSLDLLVSGPFQLLGREHELVLGGSGSRSRSHSDYGLNFVSSSDVSSIYTWNGRFPRQAFQPGPTINTTIKQSGIFGALRLSLADPFKLIIGARSSNYEIDESNDNHYKKTGQVSPYVGVIYDLDDTYSVYASYTEIFKPQSAYRDSSNRVLGPAEGKNKEIGIKGEYFGGLLNASLAVFETRLDGVAQLDAGQVLPDGTQAYRAANGTVSRGFDVEVQGEPLLDWNLYAGLSHFTAEDGDGYRLNSQIPRSTARLFTTYRLQGDWNRLTVGGGVNWQSRFYQEATNPQRQSVKVGQSSYALTSLMARYELSDTTSLSANISNLFDRKYYTTVGFQNGYLYGEPRNFMVSLHFRIK